MTASIRLFRLQDTAMSDYGEGPGSASIARLIGPDSSRTMGAYFAMFDGRSVPWTVQYDEMILCLSGTFRLRTRDEVHELGPGDMLWIGNGTELRYEGEQATVFIAIAPVDWRDQQPNA